MIMPLLLFDFPCDLLTALCTEWIALSDVCKLDSAICLRSNRTVFLSAVGSESAIFGGVGKAPEASVAVKYLEWLVARRISITQLELNEIPISLHFARFCNKVVRGLKNLKVNSCRNIPILASIVSVHCTALERLDILYECPVHSEVEESDAIKDADMDRIIGACPNLTSLRLIGLKYLTGSFLSRLGSDGFGGSLANLEIGCDNLSYRHFATEGGALPSLRTWSLLPSESADENTALIAIRQVAAACPNITDLSIRSGHFGSVFDDAALRQLCGGFHHLTDLALVDTEDVTSLQPLIDAPCAQTLQNLTQFGQVTGGDNCDLLLLLTGLPRLQSLELKEPADLIDFSLPENISSDVSRKNQTIKDLRIIYCDSLLDEGLQQILWMCPRLTSAVLISLSSLTDTAIEAVGRHCPALTQLTVQDCPSITEDAFIDILTTCPQLELLNVANSPNIDSSRLVTAMSAIAPPQLRTLGIGMKSSGSRSRSGHGSGWGNGSTVGDATWSIFRTYRNEMPGLLIQLLTQCTQLRCILHESFPLFPAPATEQLPSAASGGGWGIGGADDGDGDGTTDFSHGGSASEEAFEAAVLAAIPDLEFRWIDVEPQLGEDYDDDYEDEAYDFDDDGEGFYDAEMDAGVDMYGEEEDDFGDY